MIEELYLLSAFSLVVTVWAITLVITSYSIHYTKLYDFSGLTISHIPVENEGIYLGCISENDANCFESEMVIKDCSYAIEGFFVRNSTNWLDILETFAKNSSNIMPVLDEHSTYLGYYELRITSYNVCYTKLLRIHISSFSCRYHTKNYSE